MLREDKMKFCVDDYGQPPEDFPVWCADMPLTPEFLAQGAIEILILMGVFWIIVGLRNRRKNRTQQLHK